MKKHNLKQKGKRALSMLLALIMVLTVASPAMSPVMGIIAKAADTDLVELAFDNLFIFEQWAKSDWSGALPGGYTGDYSESIANGSFTIKNGMDGTNDFYTGFSWDKCNGYYIIPVEENTDYNFYFDVKTTGEYDAFAFFYNKEQTYIGSLAEMGPKIGSGSNISNSWEFTTPEDTAYIQVRFDSDTYGVTSTFSNIRICKADTYVGLSSPLRQTYTKNSGTYGTLPTPTRGGYVFGGWFTADGVEVTENTEIGSVSRTVFARWDLDVSSISVKEKPAKTEYSKGEHINATGLVLNAVAGSETHEITSGFTCAPEYLNTVGTQTITVTYGGKTTTFDVVVKDSVQKNISVDGTSKSATVTTRQDGDKTYTVYTFFNYTKAFNYYKLTYKTSSYMKGILTFNDGTSEEFYLEPSDNGNFTSYITDYFTVGENNLTRTGIKSLEFTYLDKNFGDFELLSVTTANETRVYTEQKFSNDHFTVGINYKWGGTLYYLEDIKNNPKATADPSGTKLSLGTTPAGLNLINTYDKGRYVQAAYYGTDGTNDDYVQGYYGTDKNGDPQAWPYNPVQGGNQKNNDQTGYNAASKVVDYKTISDEKGRVTEIYVKTQPLDWAKHKDDITPSYMETRYVFEQGMIKAYCRFIDFSGYNHNAEKRQEIPAFYPIEPLNEFVYYTGGEAWSGSNIQVKKGSNDLDFNNIDVGSVPEEFLDVNENWAAFIDSSSNYGIGVYSSRADGFSAGVFRPKTGAQKSTGATPTDDDPASYVTPFATYKMESYKVEESAYYITTGTPAQIRSDFARVANPNYGKDFGKGKIAVPETVYLTPSTGSSTTGQYYVNNTIDETTHEIVPDAESSATQGKLHFYVPGAKSVSYTVSGATITSGATTLSPDANGYASATVKMNSSTALSAGQPATAEWKFTVTMEDGTEQIHYAYTTFYAPNYHSVGATAEARQNKSNQIDMAGWISGIHSVTDAVAPLKTTNNYALDNSGAFKSEPLLLVNSNSPMTPYGIGTSCSTGDSNSNLTTSSDGKNYVGELWRDDEGHGGSSSYVGLLNVDISRNKNLNTIPNVYVGAEFLRAEYSGDNDKQHFYATYKKSDGTSETIDNSSLMSGGTQFMSLSSSNGTFTGTLRTSSTDRFNTSNITGFQQVLNNANSGHSMGIHTVPNMTIDSTENQYLYLDAQVRFNNKTWIGGTDRYAHALAAVKLNVLDKSDLRNLVLQASAVDESMGYTTTSWNTFKSDLQAAAQVLGDPDVTATEVTNATTNLKNAINGLQTVVKVYENKDIKDNTFKEVLVNVARVDDKYNVTLDSAAKFAPDVPARNGYELVSWSNSRALGAGTDYGKGTITVPFNSIIYAQWKPVQYKVTYNPNGGTMGTTSTTYTIEDTFALEGATKTGYTLTGWQVTLNDGNWSGTLDAGEAVTGQYGNVTLTAQWTPNTYKISFNANGGTGTMGEQSVVYDTEAKLNSNSFTRTGYKFSGWNTNADGSGTGYTDGQTVKNLATSGTVTLYAQWVKAAYTVKFDKNDSAATGTMNAVQVDAGVSYTLPANGFSKTGYTFAGWSKSATGAVEYTDGASVKDLTEGGSEITLYAQWKPATYKVTFDSTADTITVTYDSAYGTLPTATREGYTFKGWSLNGSTVTEATVVKTASDHTLVAVWEAKEYTFNFATDVDGVANPGKQTAKYDEYIDVPDATWEYGTFVGWSLNEDTNPYTGTGMYKGQVPVKDIVKNSEGTSVQLHAVWKLNNKVVKDDAIVADFTQSVKFNPYEMGDHPALMEHAEKFCNNNYQVAFSGSSAGQYGTFTLNGETVTYKPDKVMLGVDTVDMAITLDYGSGNTQTFNSKVTVVPASNMYYEESFASTIKGNSNSSTLVDWQKKGSSVIQGQDFDLQEDVYGYDKYYAESTSSFSDGTYYKTEVYSANDATNNQYKRSETVVFEFYGTGFDYVSACGTTTGVQAVKVSKDGVNIKNYVIDTYLSDTSLMTSGDDGKALLHQVPVLSYHDTGKDATYTVEVTALYLSSAGAVKGNASLRFAECLIPGGSSVTTTSTNATSDVIEALEELGLGDMTKNLEMRWMDDDSVLNGGTGADKGSVFGGSAGVYFANGDETQEKTPLTSYIDGFRVYNNGGEDYYKESEQNPTYYNIVEDIANKNSGNFTPIQSGDPDFNFSNIFDYSAYLANGGPKGEIYLKKGEAIAFSFNAETNGDDSVSVMLGMRAVKGNAVANVTTNNTEIEAVNKSVTSATEMYYDVSSAVTVVDGVVIVAVANTGADDSVLAVNNLKLVNGKLTSTGDAGQSESATVVGGTSSVPTPVVPVVPVVPENNVAEGNAPEAVVPETDTTEPATPETDVDNDTVADDNAGESDFDVSTLVPGMPASVASFLELLFKLISQLVSSLGF